MAKTIRRILVDRAKLLRARGTAENSEFEQNILSIEAACADLEAVDPRANRVFELVFFGGLSIDATAEILGVSSRTAKRDWLMARAFLASTISRNKQ
jgi:DNA-directed RNA polymerase specialized sigma24 family protein